MGTLERTFGCPVGYSDHTVGITVSLAAVALGACVIEKHFTLDRALPGPDHLASIEPGELRALVSGVRVVEMALGHGRKEPVSCEAEIAIVSRKSIVAARDIPAGTQITANLLAMKYPGTGFAPSMLESVVGRIASRDIPADTVIAPGMLR
jgi:sialic acid synthase SpsE